MSQFNDGTVVIVSNELINAEIKNVVKLRPPFGITKFLIQCGGTRLIQTPKALAILPVLSAGTVARLGFKRRATTVPNSVYKL